MTVEVKQLPTSSGDGRYAVHMTIRGKLEKSDYDRFVPELDREIDAHGKIGLLIELADFHGWTAGAVWEDTKFGVRHFKDFDRMAVVGDQQWEETMTKFVKPFTRADVRYFDSKDRAEASSWVQDL